MRFVSRIVRLAVVAALVTCTRVGATPFADVPSSHWAYADIQSLAADGLIEGYPPGYFKGDRPLTRYEMAVIVARVMAKIQAEGAATASRADLETLQKLVDALKDELDALGVRVASVEDALARLDARTKVAQAIRVHGTILAGGSFRQRVTIPSSVVNATGAPQTPYYSGGVAVAPGGTLGIDEFVAAYASTPDSNSPLDQQIGPQTLLRMDDRLSFAYSLDDNVTVTVPVHIASDGAGGTVAGGSRISIVPDIVIDVAHAGAFTNLSFRDGRLDNILSSRLGLTYRAPTGSNETTFANPAQPYPNGFEIGGVLGGLTDFQVAFSRVDQTLIDTQTGVAGTDGDPFAGNYFTYVVRPQTGYVQVGPVGAAAPTGSFTSDTFRSGAGALAGIYLSKKAVAGTVFVSAYATPAGAATYNNAGTLTGGGGPGLAVPPAFSYLDGLNEIIFAPPLPPGASVTLTYVGLAYTNNQQYQRYQTSARINQKIAGLPGAEVGLSFHRLWDENYPATPGDVATLSPGPNGYPAGFGFGEVSNAVFGIDFAAPLAFVRGPGAPVLFGEAAASENSIDARNVPLVRDGAAVVGLRLTLGAISASLQYQSVGTNYIDGAPMRYFGNAPPAWANYSGEFTPQFFGFANNLGINQTFDASINQSAPGRSAVAGNPALTFIYPVFNPFVASGAAFYSGFTPNTQGLSATFLAPFAVGGIGVNARLFAEHLTEIAANANATTTFGPQFPSNVRASWDTLTLGATFGVPVARLPLTVNLSGTLDRLRRADTTAYAYVPYNPAAAAYDPGAALNFTLAGGTFAPSGAIATTGSSAVRYYPNYVDMVHTTLVGGVSLPVSRDVVFSTRYSDQRYFGSYGTTLARNIGGTKDQFDLGLTYTVPATASSVGVAYRNSTYKDAALPSFNLTQNREDVNFTIRF